MMSDCHMLRMNVCDVGRHAETQKRVDIYKSASVACARALNVHDRLFVIQTGRQAGTRKGLTFIRVEDALSIES